MPNLHPFVVHFPIALLTVSFAFDLVAFLRQNEALGRTAWWMFATGVVGLIGAVVTGLLAERSITLPVAAASAFETHEQIAFLASTLYAILALWRLASRTYLPAGREQIYLALSFCGVLLIWAGAWYGGELVYVYGAGVQGVR